VVFPHQPYWEQQLPKVDFWQVKPFAPEHVPSVETLRAGVVGVAALEEVAAFVVAAFDGTAPLEPQLPKPDWHPVPQ
jgi:hypothetical protein